MRTIFFWIFRKNVRLSLFRFFFRNTCTFTLACTELIYKLFTLHDISHEHIPDLNLTAGMHHRPAHFRITAVHAHPKHISSLRTVLETQHFVANLPIPVCEIIERVVTGQSQLFVLVNRLACECDNVRFGFAFFFGDNQSAFEYHELVSFDRLEL